MQVRILERAELADGTLRAHVALDDGVGSDASRLTPAGWVSCIAKDGRHNLAPSESAEGLAALEAADPSQSAKPKLGSRRASAQAEPDAARRFVTRAKLKLRAQMELGSNELGEVAASTRVVVLERAMLADGTQRAQIARAATNDDDGELLGWVSAVGKDARENLVADWGARRTS